MNTQSAMASLGNDTGLFNHPRAMAQMDALKLDALIGATFTNCYYVSGVRTLFNDWYFSEPYAAAIVPRDPARDATLVTMAVFLPALASSTPTWMPNVSLYDWYAIDKTLEPPDHHSGLAAAMQAFMETRVRGELANDIVTATVAALRRSGLTRGRIGFDDLRFGRYIQQQLPALEIVDAHQTFMRIRKIRTPREIQLLSYAARINQLALEAAITEMRPGVSWRELAWIYKQTWMAHGGRAVSDKGLFWGGTFNGEYIPDTFFMPDNDFKLEAGKYYLLEGEGHVLQYHADCNRSVFLGDPPAAYLKGVDAVMHAYAAMEDVLRPGHETREVYKLVKQVMQDHGVPYPAKTLVATHGVGLEFVEWYGDEGFPTQRGIPESYPLEAGVTLGMDCLYYGHTLGTFHFENGLLITDDGPRSFYAPPNTGSILPKGLIIRDGARTDTYCPNIELTQERGIAPELVCPTCPVPSWCAPVPAS